MENFEKMSANVLDAIVPEMFLEIPFLGVVDVTTFVVAVSVFLVLVLFFKVLQSVVLARLRRFAEKTTTDIDNTVISAIEGVRPWVYNVIALYVALLFFTLPTALDYAVTGLILFAIVWQAIEVVTTLVDYGTKRWVKKASETEADVDPDAANVANLIRLVAKIVLWALGVLFVLSNLGIEVTTLIAGLGIGGVAIAFALQGVLSDLFASFSIYFDKPFRIGDFIIIDSDMGVVERIGIKSTRLRTLQGEELVISNNELVNARVHNFKKMQERRVVVDFGITYETPYEKVRKIDSIVREIFDSLEGARLDRVHFHEFGDHALLFELVFFITSADYNQYMDIRQDFNFQLMERFAAEGIDFAYPTQVLYTKTVQ